ncbi:YngK protein, partial [Pseudomonas syringae pv. pisi str. 1704B]
FAYEDTRKWVIDGIIDYIAPQVYWPFAREVARY